MRKVIAISFCLLAALVSQATHIRCGHIKLEQVSGLTYRITLNVYTNTGSEIKFGDGILDFGDGSKPHITPTIDNTKRPDLGWNFGTVIYSINHTFAADGKYIISYTEANLDDGIVNVTNSVETSFYLESGIFIDSNANSSSPEFLMEPIFKHPIGQDYSFSAEAVDRSDYKLTYELVNPLEPGSTKFLLPENITVNYYNGLVTWDTKYKGAFQVGEYLFAVRVTQYNPVGKRMGYAIQTFQVILVDINSQIKISNPIVDTNGKLVIEEGKKKTIKVLMDVTSQPGEWKVNYDQKLNSNLIFSQYDSISGSNKIRVGLLKLNSSSDIIRDNPYAISLRARSVTANEALSKDISYLFFTKEIELPIITEVPEQKAGDIKVYPNPFTNFLKVTTDSAIEIELLDSSGQLVSRSQVTKDDLLETSQLAPGLYMIRSKVGRKFFNQKVIKK